MPETDAWDDGGDQFGSDGREQGEEVWDADASAQADMPTFGMVGLDEGPDWPDWMGKRWDDIEPEQRREAFIALRRWVDWFIGEYIVTTEYIRPCWFEHSEIRAELYGAMLAETKTWAEPGPGFTALTMWHPHMHQLLSRLNKLSAGCTNGHKPSDVAPLAYDEDRWTAVIEGEHSVVDVDRGAGTWLRARVISETGEPIESAPVAISAAKKAPAAVLLPLETASLADPGRVQVRAVVEGRHHELSWERSDNEGSTWTAIPDGEGEPPEPDPAEVPQD